MSALTFLLSIPRSGSTVLSGMLDRIEGAVCLPEAVFPQALGQLSAKERADRRWVAAIYLGSCLNGSLLELGEAEACISDDSKETLINLGRAAAAKVGRDPASIRQVIWKTTRLISFQQFPLATGGQFVVIRRPLPNVFESNLRVDFGLHNRRPWRFAAFVESYEATFAGLPRSRTLEVDYRRLGEELPEIARWLGLDPDRSQAGPSSLQGVAENFSYHTSVLQSFKDRDAEKIAKVTDSQRHSLERASHAFRLLRPALRVVRRFADDRSMETVRRLARGFLAHA